MEVGNMWALQWLRATGTRFVTVRVNGEFPLKIDINDGIIAPTLYLTGRWEPFESDLVTRVLRPGMTFVDVGANLGYYAVLAGRLVGPAGRVLAFEPGPDNFRLLTENVALNQLEAAVVPEQAALTARTGEVDLYLNRYLMGDHRIYQPAPDDELHYHYGLARPRVRVQAYALDEYLAMHGHPAVNAVKIDVQGAEMEVFAGMRFTFTRNPEMVLFVEFTPYSLLQCGTPPAKLIEFLRGEQGMTVLRIDKETRKLVPFDERQFIAAAESHHFIFCDLFCCRDPAASDLGDLLA